MNKTQENSQRTGVSTFGNGISQSTHLSFQKGFHLSNAPKLKSSSESNGWHDGKVKMNLSSKGRLSGVVIKSPYAAIIGAMLW